MLRAFLCMLIVLRLSQFGDAAVLNTDTVLGPDHPYPGETIVVVDGLSPPTEVTVLDGAIIGSLPDGGAVPVGIDVFGASIVNMLGGRIRASERSVLLHDQSVFRIGDGRLGLIESRDISQVILDGGEWGSVNAYGSSRVRVNGGDDGSIFEVTTFGESHAVINGAELNLIAAESSTVVINDGMFEGLLVSDNAKMLVNGGHFIVGIAATGNGVVRLRSVDGFADDEPLYVQDNGVIHIYGTGLRFGIDPFTDQPSVLGTLADGDPFSGQYRIFDQGQIILHEVPEPGAVGLLGIGVAGGVAIGRGGRRKSGNRAWRDGV